MYFSLSLYSRVFCLRPVFGS